jgi:antagonist of KipI
MSIVLHKTGMLALIQDKGRNGYRHIGIPTSGPMDEQSFLLAQACCGNQGHEPLIEFTLHGAVIEFKKATTIALTGGGATAIINNQPIPYNQAQKIEKGAILKLLPAPYGCRTYLAVQGGFLLQPALGSCSTYTPAEIGGITGRALQAGDSLAWKEITSAEINKQITVNIQNQALLSNTVQIKCYPGPEWNWFSDNSQANFLKQAWKIDPQSNRMGYVLNGDALQLIKKKELISTAVMPGIIQVTPAGNPIILLADAQTIGGYPRIGRLHASAFPIIGQCRPGTTIEFNLVQA